MDYQALASYINGDPELSALAAEGADEAIAQTMNARTAPVYVTTEIGNGLVLATIGLTAGNALLDAINALPDFRHVRPLLEQGRLDISSPLAQGALDSLVGAVPEFTADHVNALKALAAKDAPVFGTTVSNMDVARALRG